MPIRTIFMTVFLSFLLITSLQAKKIDSYWDTEKIKIDGQIDEWTGHGMTHFEDEKFSISFRNDSTNFYILVATRDTRLMHMIYRDGINLWVNLDGKDKKEFGVKYFSQAEPPKMTELEQRMGGNDSKFEEMKKKEEQMRGKIIITEKDNQRMTENTKDDKIRAASLLYKGAYLIEVKIPFDSGELLTKLKKNEQRKDLKVGVEIGMDPKKMMGERRDESFDGGGARPGGMGGGPPGGGGGMGGRPGGGPGGGRGPQMTKIDEWIKVVLNHKK